MTAAGAPQSTASRSIASRLVRAGLVTGVVDGLWAIVFTLAYGRSIARLWQGVAATPFGAKMFERGAAGVAVGLLIHFCVAFTWSALLLLLVLRWSWLRGILESRYGALKVGAVYGPMVWIVMSTVVIPTLSGQRTMVTYRWWIQLAGHAAFVGLPMAWAIRQTSVNARWRPGTEWVGTATGTNRWPERDRRRR